MSTAVEDNAVRWIITASKSTDIAVRSLLAQKGLKKGGLSKFIEEALAEVRAERFGPRR
jgi:hypothetical protein